MTGRVAIDAASAWGWLCGLAQGAGVPDDPRITLGAQGWTAHAAIADDAAQLLDLFLPLLPPVAPEGIVVGQLGQSLDGRIATETGHSHYVTGAANRTHLHRLRALCDAVVVGAGTVLADDPRLTVRLCTGPNPVRVVLDARGELPADLGLFTDGAAPTWLVRPPGVATAEPPVPLLAVDSLTPGAVLAALRARGLRRILVEGGGRTVSRFLDASALDRLHVAVAPLLIGAGRPGLDLPPVADLAQARRPRMCSYAMPPDTLFDCDLRG